MVKISLPNPNDYQHNISGFFRQMELAIHHARKSWEDIVADATAHPEEWAEDWKENFFITYRFPEIDLNEREQDDDGNAKVHVDEEANQMQNVEIEIGSV